jgi:hypothetical protein
MNEDLIREEEMSNFASADATPDEAMANLAFATNLQEQILGQGQEQSMEDENSPETVPEQPQTEEAPQDDVQMGELIDNMEDFKQEVRYTLKKELEKVREDIKKALDD